MSLAVSMSTVTSTLTCVCPRQALACCCAFSFRCQSDVRFLPLRFGMEDFAMEDFSRANTDPTAPRCQEAEGRQRRNQTSSVRGYRGRRYVLVRRKYIVVQRQLFPPHNSSDLRHLLYRRRPVPTKCTSSSSMSSGSPSSCTSVFDRGLIFVESHGSQECIQRERCGRTHWTESPDETATPTCHQGCSLALSFVEGTVAVFTWCSWFTIRSFFRVWWLFCRSGFERRLEGRRRVS